MFFRKYSIHSILTGVFIVSGILFSQKAAAQTVEESDVLPVVQPDSTDIIIPISSADSALYVKFLYPPVEPPFVYADTLILNADNLPFIFNKSRIDLHPLTPPLFKQNFPSLEEQFLPGRLFSDRYNRNYLHKKAYNDIIDNHPELIKYSKEDLAGEVEKISEMGTTILDNLFKIEYEWDEKKVDKPERYRPKRKYWVWKGTHFLQLAQTDDSKNWDKSGFGNINFQTTHKIDANFKKNKWQINQSLEWRLHIANNANDTLRWHKILEDKFRSYTTIGLQAFKYWSYSSNMEITTQAFSNFVENKTDRIASLLSPFKLNAGLGMNYTINKTYPNKNFPKLAGRKVSFTTDISPLSVQYINLLSSVTSPSRYGIKEGSSQLDLGTTVNAKLLINFTKTLSYMTRVNYFTNYHKVYSEWENDLNLPLNRYFSVRLYFFATFDDTREEDAKYGYVQMKETFSFGFNYAW